MLLIIKSWGVHPSAKAPSVSETFTLSCFGVAWVRMVEYSSNKISEVD